MESVVTAEQLLELLKGNQRKPEEELNTESIKYALYARKSTQDDERQERSIDDQINDCMSREVIPNQLSVTRTIQESYSAKEPDTRLKFREMIMISKRVV